MFFITLINAKNWTSLKYLIHPYNTYISLSPKSVNHVGVLLLSKLVWWTKACFCGSSGQTSAHSLMWTATQLLAIGRHSNGMEWQAKKTSSSTAATMASMTGRTCGVKARKPFAATSTDADVHLTLRRLKWSTTRFLCQCISLANSFRFRVEGNAVLRSEIIADHHVCVV